LYKLFRKLNIAMQYSSSLGYWSI